MTEIAQLIFPAHDGNTDFREPVNLSIDGTAVASPPVSAMKATFRRIGSDADQFTLSQVVSAIQGLYPVPSGPGVEAGDWAIQIDRETISTAVPAAAGGTLYADLIATESDGTVTALARITLPIFYGTTEP